MQKFKGKRLHTNRRKTWALKKVLKGVRNKAGIEQTWECEEGYSMCCKNCVNKQKEILCLRGRIFRKD